MFGSITDLYVIAEGKMTIHARLLLLVFLLFHVCVDACVLKMGYRTNEKLPFIEAAPNNAGIYLELYTKAAQGIGCRLSIIRQPKKRILQKLYSGQIDFYPGLTFTELRSNAIFFLENGLPSADVGLTRGDVENIASYRDLRGRVVLLALGAPRVDSEKYSVLIKRKPELTIEQAIKIILSKQAYFYKDELSVLSYYLQEHSEISQVKLHYLCCGGVKSLTAGFSRLSHHYSEELNPDFDDKQVLSHINFPYRLNRESLAYRFYQELMRLKVQHYTEQLYQSYINIDLNQLMLTNENAG